MEATNPGQSPIAFEDIALYFNSEEWTLLHPFQRHTYEAIMIENYETVTFVEQISVHIGRQKQQIESSQQKFHTWKKTFNCRVCRKTFSQHSQQVHQRIHKEEKSYKGQDGGKNFSYKLFMHENTYKVKKAYNFEECRLSFDHSTHLIISHQITHRREIPLKCLWCRMDFRRKINLISHQKTHRGEKPYKCQECGKNFSYKCSLIMHEKTYKEENPLKCQECRLSFGQSSRLIRHKKTHTGERLFKCLECGVTFSRKNNLIRHQRTHTGEKPYKCQECRLSFVQSSNLIIHQRTHTEKKPYKCQECGVTFSRKNNLIRHQRTHTGEKP